jgi:hypothetical protein
MIATAAQMAAYLYPEEEDPEGAFSWWLAPCGGTQLVPDEIKKIFGILSTVADGVTSFAKPKNVKKGSGKKGDDANPHESDRSKPGSGSKPPPKKTTPKCKIPAKDVNKVVGDYKHVWQKAECKAGTTHLTQWIISKFPDTVWQNAKSNQSTYFLASLTHVNAQAVQVQKTCSKKWSQACYHYSSAISRNPSWSTMSCHTDAATTAYRRTYSGSLVTPSKHTLITIRFSQLMVL